MFIIIDFILAAGLFMVLLSAFKNRTKISPGRKAVLVVCTLFLAKIILGIYSQRNFYLGYYYHWKDRPEISKVYFSKYINEGPANKLLRIALHYDSGYPQALKMIGKAPAP